MNNKRTLLTSWCRCPLGRLVAILVRIMISHVFVSSRKLFRFTLFWSTQCWLANIQLPAESSCWQSRDVMLQNDSCPWFELKTSPVRDGNHNSEDVCFYFVCWCKHNCHSPSSLSVLRQLRWRLNFLGVGSIKSYLIVSYHILSYVSYVSYGMVWYHIVLYRILWYRMAWYHIVLYRIAWYGILSYGIVLYSILSYHIVWYCILWYGMVSYRIVLYRIASYYIALHRIASHPMVWYGILAYCIASYLIVPCHTVSYSILFYPCASFDISLYINLF